MGNPRKSNATDAARALTWPLRWAESAVPGDSGGTDRPILRPRDVVALLAPSTLAVVYGVLVFVFGANVLDTGRSWPASGVAFGLLGVLFLASAWGTIRLYDDARRVADADPTWRPNPWSYVLFGTLALLVLRAVQLAVDGRPLADPVPVFAGTAVVSAAMSALVAGPLYLLQRLRHA